jgi:hydrogenase-4 component F
MALGMILLPVAMAALAFAIPSNRLRPWTLPVAAAAHLGMTLLALARPEAAAEGSWLALDAPGRLVLLVVSVLFFFCSF